MEVDYYDPTEEAADRSNKECNRLLLPRSTDQSAIDGVIGPVFHMQVFVHLSSVSIVIDHPMCYRLSDLHREQEQEPEAGKSAFHEQHKEGKCL